MKNQNQFLILFIHFIFNRWQKKQQSISSGFISDQNEIRSEWFWCVEIFLWALNIVCCSFSQLSSLSPSSFSSCIKYHCFAISYAIDIYRTTPITKHKQIPARSVLIEYCLPVFFSHESLWMKMKCVNDIQKNLLSMKWWNLEFLLRFLLVHICPIIDHRKSSDCDGLWMQMIF